MTRPTIAARGKGAAALAVAATLACASAPRLETLHATLWMQTAAEYEALAEQTYRAAEAALARALADSGWTAALEQSGSWATLPPAVVVDVDETVLDTTPYETRSIREGRPFEPESWKAWVNEAEARPVPGALGFARRAAELGVTLFYLTNRDAELEPATRRNLAAVGFPLAAGDVVLHRGERPEWTSDKSIRRAWVADSFRVLLLVGDDLNDFVSARVPASERDALVEVHREKWGERWFVLPNPIYGSWVGAVTGYEDLPPERSLERRIEALRAE